MCNYNNVNLTNVLGWGYLDVDFLNTVLEKNKIDMDVFLDRVDSFRVVGLMEYFKINNWIYTALEMSAENFLNDVKNFSKKHKIKFQVSEIKINIVVNYLDSWLEGDLFDVDLSDRSEENFMNFLSKIKVISKEF